MPNDAVDDAGTRFGRDMRRIREARDVSVDTIHTSTRIAHTLIETFEETGLVDHPAFNRVYLRSFVRSYAEAVDISEEVALNALDRALDGAYTDELAAFVEGGEAESLPVPPAAEADGADDADAESSTDASDEAEDDTTAPPASPPAPDPPASPSSGTEPAATDAGSSLQSSASEAPAREHPRMVNEGAPESPPAADRTAPATGTQASSDPSARAESDAFDPAALWERLQRPVFIGLAVLIVLLLLGGGLYAVLWGGSEPAPPAADTSQTAPAESLTAASMEPARPPANVTLGDTLYLTVVADADVRGIRIKRDDDLRRPYWIDSTEATVFPFREEVRIEDELDHVRLLLQGYLFPERFADAQGRIVITRDTAEAFADTLRGAPVRLDTPPDTTRIPSFAQ